MWTQIQQGNRLACLRFAIELGLRHPSEPTARNLSLCLLAAEHGVAVVHDMPRANKIAFITETKNELAKLRLSSLPPNIWISKLLATPEEFHIHYPLVYESVYTSAPPGVPPWNNADWALLTSTTNCRKERGTSAAASATFAPAVACMQEINVLKDMMRDMRNGGVGNRLRFDQSPMTLSNGALLTFGNAGVGVSQAAPNQPPAVAWSAQQALTAPPVVVPGAVVVPPAEEPATAAKRQRVSVQAAAEVILGDVEKGAKHKEGGMETTDTGASDAKPDTKKKPVNRWRWEHHAAAKKYAIYWNKLNCKNFPYKAPGGKKDAEKLAREWLKAKCEPRGWEMPRLNC